MLLIWGRCPKQFPQIRRHNAAARNAATQWHDGQFAHGAYAPFARRALHSLSDAAVRQDIVIMARSAFCACVRADVPRAAAKKDVDARDKRGQGEL
jgi:hypothetical protein